MNKNIYTKTPGIGASGKKSKREKGTLPRNVITKLGRKPKAKNVKKTWRDRSGLIVTYSIKPSNSEKGKPKKRAKSK